MDYPLKKFISDLRRMSPKLKTVLGVLSALALVFVFRIFGFFGSHLTANISGTITNSDGTVTEAGAARQPVLIYNNVTDKDGDGLPDAAESRYASDTMLKDTDNDGYIDGEEVAAGYDPSFDENKAAKDKAVALDMNSKNLTMALINRTVGGYLAGDITLAMKDSADPTNTLNLIAMATLDEALPKLQVDASKIISSTDMKASEEKYLSDFSEMIEPNFISIYNGQQPLLIKMVQDFTMGDNNAASEKLTTISSTYSDMHDRLSTIRVPPRFRKWHEHLMEVSLNLSNDFLQLKKASDDPVLGLVALDQITGYFSEFTGIISGFGKLISDGKLAVPETTLFKTLNLLNGQSPQ
ncbi:MAG: Uncharacterized protein CEN90_505 [Parcubacteria group bacterium Licking1014_17]|nr:MAG: Uncharacterized protein CEN90_505 [Parcubacteria group bacterium Licking1014_17]